MATATRLVQSEEHVFESGVRRRVISREERQRVVGQDEAVQALVDLYHGILRRLTSAEDNEEALLFAMPSDRSFGQGEF